MIREFIALTVLFALAQCVWYNGFSKERPFRVRTMRFICVGPKIRNLSIIHECSLKLVRNKPSLISFSGAVPYPLESVWITTKIWFKTNINTFHPLLGIDERIDYCKLMLNDTSGNMFAPSMFKAIQRYASTMPCPIHGEFSFKNMSYDDDMFPPFLPVGDFRNDIRLMLDNNETIFALQFYGTVRAKGIADLSMG